MNNKNKLSQKNFLELNWSGKSDLPSDVDAILTNKKLVLKKNLSVNPSATKNMLIVGDNLDGLKLLLKDYEEKIRVIYIDPPYNTGHKFVYNDNFAERNCQHSKWCAMIYPRLILAQKLLDNDGIIFISIDGGEVNNLKLICDEIFGEENFITQFIYEKTQHFGRQKLNCYSNVDYILCYAKNKINQNGKVKELLVERIHSNLLDAPLYNASNRTTKITFPANTVKFKISDGLYNKTDSLDYILHTPVIVSNGTNDNDFVLEFKSRWSNQTVQEEIKEGTRFWVKTKTFAIRTIYSDKKITKVAPKQIIFTNPENPTKSRFEERVLTSETATAELKEILGTDEFSYPKSLSLISYLISLIFDEKKNDFAKHFTVLDFFAGSGTTAHACMHLNNIDNGNRNFILIQTPEIANSKNYQDISEICRDRIIKSAIKYNYQNIDTDFKYYRIEE